MHFNLFNPLTLASLASPTFNIKTKSTWLITSYLCFICFRKKISNMSKNSSISCWIRSWSFSYGGLIYINNFIYFLPPKTASCSPASTFELYIFCLRAFTKTSSTNVLFPEPETPVMQTNCPIGI